MFCSNCGKEIPEGERFCSNCGADMPTSQQRPTERQHAQPPINERDNKTLVMWIVLALLLAAIVILVLVFVVFPAGKGDEEPENVIVEQTEEPEDTPVPTQQSTEVPTQQPTQQPMPTEATTELPTESKTLVGTGMEDGDTIYNFDVPILGGGNFVLSDNLDKPVLINIFATWCGPCVAELPSLQQIYDEYGQEMHVIIINVGEEESAVQQFVNDNQYTMPFALSGNEGPWPDEYFVEYIPQTFMVSTDGTIIKFVAGSTDHASFERYVIETIEASK